ncbi:MAG: hypothetical protein N3D11_16210 [Candidatus Sumerlaeia bacterium]|nr:hypothetical protein [Candidatus Sumerlaeia bacterium]
MPEPPRTILSVRPSTAVVTGATYRVDTAAAFEAALRQARPGDEIVLTAGKTFIGNFTLPWKAPTGWITICSSELKKLPLDGVRVAPQDAAAMPKIVSPNDRPALTAAPAAGFYRLVGLEITQADNVGYNYGLVEIGAPPNHPDRIPRGFILDRLYIHGRPNAALKRGVGLNGAAIVVANCYIADCHVEGQDAQAIGGFSGPGPFKIINNYLEGSGENVMFGGADPVLSDLVPSDIEIRGNHFSKPLSWRKQEPAFAGRAWTVKNLLEFKNARRVVVEGNVLEYSWVHGQVGFALLITPRNQGGKAPWSTVEDLAFVNNIVRHCSSGIAIAGEDDNHRSQTTKRVLIRNNLFEEINPTRWGGDGRLIQLTSPRQPAEDIVIERNTFLHSGRGNTFITMGGRGKVARGLIVRDNIATRGQYGIHGDGKAGAIVALDAFCDGYVLTGNLIVGAGGDKGWPTGNHFVPTLDAVGFQNPAAGDYSLKPDSPWRSRGAHGGPIGADMEALRKATARAVSGGRD